MPLHDYDPDELRRCASELSDAAEEISGQVAGQLRRAHEDAPNELAGGAARALEAALRALTAELDDISHGLRSLGGQLSAFADKSQLL